MDCLVSIVVPVYNMGDSIDRCVESLLRQSYKNIEIILVDDGSKDDSYSRCLKYSELDPRVKTYHTENQGSGPARNYGISKATGKYICFPDADDFYNENAIQQMLAGMCEGNADFVIAGYESVDENGAVITHREYTACCVEADEMRNNYSKYLGRKEKLAINGAPWNKLYDLELIRSHAIAFPPLRRHQDAGFILRYLTHCKKVSYISDVVYIHYLNDIRKEWYKYPENYIDSVIGLRKIQGETVLAWNPNDRAVVNKIDQNYISGCIKAMELLFSPRLSLSLGQKRKRLIDILNKSSIFDYHSQTLGTYQKIVFALLKSKCYFTALFVFKVKISFEKAGTIRKLRK